MYLVKCKEIIELSSFAFRPFFAIIFNFNLSLGFQSWEIEKRNDYSGCFGVFENLEFQFQKINT
jgi:hypothetical protein